MLTRISTQTPAANRNLTQLATVKTELQITASADDAFLTSLLKQSSSAIETFCGRIFAAQTYVETFRMDVYRLNLLLAQFPLVQVVSVSEAGVALVTDTDFETFDAEGLVGRIISDRTAYWRTLDRIAVTYTAGYSLPGDTALTPPALALPSDIERACIELVKTEYLSRTRNPNVQRFEIPDVYSESYMQRAIPGAAGGYALPPNIAGMLTAYKDMRAI